MIDVHCDANVCACPSACEGHAKLEEFIVRILFVRDISALPSVSISISRCTAEILYTEGCMPLRATVENVISELGWEDVNARDILEIVHSILTREPFLEDILGINDVLYEEFSTLPQLSPGRNLAVHLALEKHILLATLLVHLGIRQAEDSIIVVTNNGDRFSNQLEVTANITCVDGSDLIAMPTWIKGQVLFCQEWHSFCSCIDPAIIWLASKSQVEHSAALKLFITKVLMCREKAEGLSWRFGRSFLESVGALNFDTNLPRARMLLRAVGEVLLRTNLNATHAIRESAGGNSAQLRRGLAKAWRRDIDYEFHLHYWDDGQAVEFSRVVTHNDFIID